MADSPSNRGSQSAGPGTPLAGTGVLPFRDGHTWYRVAGEEGAPPLVLLHGGPGGGHEYLLPLIDLFGAERTLVFYDQVGCGNSTAHADWPDESFTVELFLAELEALTEHLNLRRFHLLGHSWGGMLATEYALRHPEQLVSLTLCSTAASARLMMGSLLPLYTALAAEGVPPEQFADEFGARHICRITPIPEGLARSLAMITQDPRVNQAMTASDDSGETVGTLRGWSSEDRLPRISAPTLVMHGEFDELDASAHRPFLDRIPDVRGHVFVGASHTSFSETPEEFREVLGSFLAQAETAEAAAQ